MHGYWTDPKNLSKQLIESKPIQVRFLTPYGELFQGDILDFQVEDRKVIQVKLRCLTRRVLSLNSISPSDDCMGRAERWEYCSVEEGFGFQITFRSYYYQRSRGTDHPGGFRPQRIKVFSTDRHSFWFLSSDDPLIILHHNGIPIPRFLMKKS